MNRKLFSIGFICFITLFLILHFVHAQDSRPMVRVVYRPLPGNPPHPDANAEIDALIKKIQRFFADEMERHGFGRKTFQIETDASGNTVVHQGELGSHGKNIVVYMEEAVPSNARGCGVGAASGSEGREGSATIYCWNWHLIAHELGHAFGLWHDFRAGSDNYIMSYGPLRHKLSKCAAEWLDTHRAFNPGRSTENKPTKIQLLSSSLDSPPNTVRLRFKVTDPDGLHQVQLLTPTVTPGISYGSLELLNYKALNGSTNTTVEFVTNLTPNNRSVSLMAIDVNGNFTWNLQKFPINVTSLLPQAEAISFPDANLAAVVRQTLSLSSSEAITTHSMLNLLALDAPNSGITDLTGLEHAHNLRGLNLAAEYIEGEGYVNSNTVSNVSALSTLTHLTWLNLQNNNISDISALSALTNLNTLNLQNNNISDIYALSTLTQLTELILDNNNISDVSPLSGLTLLTQLALHNNNISDIYALSGLKNLASLNLQINNISDLSPLLALNPIGTQWDSTELNLRNNPLSYVSINTHIPAMQAKGIAVQYDQRTPTKLLKISGDAQQAVTNSELPLPYVVQVQDQSNRAYAEVPVTFTITNGEGKLNTTKTKTDTKGNAQARLTFGETEGRTTVQATVPNITQPIQFTATAVSLDLPVSLPDDHLYAKIIETLGKPTDASITVTDMLMLTSLTANNISISTLTGLQHASNLTTLMLDGNNLSDIDSLTGLTQLRTLSLDNNNLSNIASLVALTQLETLSLENNQLSDVAPLVELTELKTLRLRGNQLSYPSLYTTIPTLRSRGVNVVVDTRTPSTLINVPGTPGVVGAARQVLVQVQDQNGIAFAGVPVNFTLTAAGGHRFTSKAISDLNGTATTTLTLGPELGENFVSATGIDIPQPLNFTITAIDENTLVYIPDVNLHAKIAETLNKPKNATLNAGDLLALTRLDAPNANIQDLTGIEYASNLSSLYLGEAYIEGKGNINSNTVSNLSALSGLTNLNILWLSSNNISDISALSALTNLNMLNLNSNNISDISALSALTNLTWLDLYNNNISDISALSTLTQLTSLWLSNNNISDISALSTLAQLASLNLQNNDISDIYVLSGLTQLTDLILHSNNISDISALSGLTNLNTLNLSSNNISDISALSGLTQLTSLDLYNNNISDLSPLLALNLTGTQWNSTGLYLANNPLSYTSINTHIPAMQIKGVEVQYDQRTPTRLLKVSGDAQQTVTNSELPLPLVVQVQDQSNRAFAEVPVTFTITDGDGKLSTTKTKTDTKGNAQTRLTLGETGGITTVQVTVPNIMQSIQFTATAVSLDLPASLPDDNLYAKIIETLGKPSSETLTLADMLTLTSLTANNANISDLTGLEYATNLTTLILDGNNLSDIDSLTGLTQLMTLSLDNNNLTNVTPFLELPQLETLSLENGELSDVTSLVELTELKTLRLRGNLLSYPSLYTTIPNLRSRGVDVAVDTRTPTTLISIPGTHGVVGAAQQVAVQVQDQNGIAFAGVPVNFTLTAAGGHLSTSEATSNLNGKAITTLTLGPEPGENFVSATVNEIPQSLNFTITTIDANTLVHIPDVNLHAKIVETLNKPKNATLNAGDLLTLIELDAPNANIQDLTGIEYASNLSYLNLGEAYIEGKGNANSNTVSNLSALSELTNLNTLHLSSNNISDISALSALTNLNTLYLNSNNISDISPLLALNLTGTQWNSTGLYLWNNPLSYTSINTHIPAMQAKGVEVQYDQRTPTRLLKISGDAQQAVTNTELPLPYVVEVQDQYYQVFTEVPVTFTITDGDGKLSTTKTKTDTKGKAQTLLTLGETDGTTTVQATVPNITQPIQFTATAVSIDLPVSFTDDYLYAKIIETLGKPTDAPITVTDMLTLTSLTANNANISDLTGLEYATNLTTLSLDNNNLTNVTPFLELTQLETLSLENNKLSDVTSLVELTELKTLRLRGNQLSYPSLYTTMPTLRSRGVDVAVDTRTPTTFINVPEIPGVAGAARQVLVQVQDQNGIAFAGVPVNFTLTAAGGHRFTSKAISDLNGTTTTTVTLGPEPGENFVSATVIEFTQPLNFIITTIDANTLVHIPDVNLHAKIAETLNKPKNATLNAGDLLKLTRLDARNANIQDLTGIKYASNLSYLNLGEAYIEGEGYVNTNTVSDLSPLIGLTTLTYLRLSRTKLVDLSALSALTNLNTLNLDSNNISDISALSALTNLKTLNLSSNNISDISALSTLTQLTSLNLYSNNISDISALSALTQLKTLYLSSNNISDISALSGLTNLNTLYLNSNNISDMSPLLALNLIGTQRNNIGLSLKNNPLNNDSIRTHIPAMQARGIVVSFDNITQPEFLIISGDKQEELVGKTLPSPFVVVYHNADGKPREGVNVIFSIVDGEGELTDTNVTTDADGRTQTYLQLGMKLGTITVRATAEGVNTELTFTAHVVLPENRVAEDVNADGVVDVEDLVLVASDFGTEPVPGTLPDTDVNDDGKINSEDVILVLEVLEETAAAPSLDTQRTAASLQQWIAEAKQRNTRDTTFQRGIAMLEQLLATLLPNETALLANFPNPFNPETWIPYQLVESADVSITIHATDGKVVRTLVLGNIPAGIYRNRSRAAYWNGKNAAGEKVASGLYFYTLTAGDFTATRKMLILK